MPDPLSPEQAWHHLRRQRRWKSVFGAAGLMAASGVAVACFWRLPHNPAPCSGRPVGPTHAVVAYSPAYRVSFFGIEYLHSFDIFKYDRIAEALVDQGLLAPEDFLVPEEVPAQVLAAIHDPAYLAGLTTPANLSQALEVGIPGFFGAATLDSRILAPFRRASGGTIAVARGALTAGLGINLGGGYHHARPRGGHGFCIYNDVAAAVHVLRSEGFTGNILVFDTDVHQGDGNHAAFAADPSVLSYSFHQRGLFPQPPEPGGMDQELGAGLDDAGYLALLKPQLDAVLESFQPRLVFHVAGSDVLADDPLASLAMSVEGLVARDLTVASAVRSRGIPLVHLLAGGYGPHSAEAQGNSVAALLRGEW